MNYTSCLYRAISLIFFAISTVVSAAQEKVALVIGNDAYEGYFGKLTTCVNDANEMEACLAKLGYTTIILRNANRQEISDAFKKFNQIISKNKSSVGVFFYSGHAVNIGGEHLIVPAKTDIAEYSIKNDCIGTSEIKWSLKRHCKYSFLFFDSCRDSQNSDGTTKGTWSPSNIPIGTQNQQITCYATGYGKSAYTGNDRLSPFTKVLTSHLFDRESFDFIWTNKIMVEVPLLADQQPVKEDEFYEPFYFNATNVEPAVPAHKSKVNVKFNLTPSDAKIKFGTQLYDSGVSLSFEYGKTYTYTVESDGYEPYSGKLVADNSVPHSVDIDLKKSTDASFYVYANKPKSISVYLDDKYFANAPCKINTTSGKHTISFRANNFYSRTESIVLSSGMNKSMHVSLNRNVPEFFNYNGAGNAHHLTYHYSPEYHIGLSYLYTLWDVPLSFGAYVAASSKAFKFLELQKIKSYDVDDLKSTELETDDGDFVSSIVYETSVNDWNSFKYSSFIDPYNEAVKYKANFLALGNIGFNPCNGLILEAGAGAARLNTRYYMHRVYYITKTTYTDTTTGEQLRDPVYTYTPLPASRWYKGDPTWTLALRLGGKVMIPIDGFMSTSITIGGGYIYLPFQHNHSTWDVALGICSYF